MKNNKLENYKLFIDELGVASPKDTQSEVYIISACSVNDKERLNMKIKADQIKFKYWGKTDIVFHSREIGRKMGDFSLFKDKKIFKEFISDLENFISDSDFKMFFVVLDKTKARKLNWNDIKIYKETSNLILKNFLLAMISQDSKANIVIESSTSEKDFYFHKANNFFLAGGVNEVGVNYKKVQDTITSIAFVTKNNFDIEEQIADIFAYAVKCKYLLQTKKKVKIGDYEKVILDLLKKKIYKKPRKASVKKKKYLDKIEPIKILP
ncbi:MAG: DUF3800 domain-containing protein [Candidatus Pacebacteria bacterium]|nr:DUF3800 domain-containing protein [Candidatus Paceibacterota bacterium]